jgi:hypothetical protein
VLTLAILKRRSRRPVRRAGVGVAVAFVAASAALAGCGSGADTATNVRPAGNAERPADAAAFGGAPGAASAGAASFTVAGTGDFLLHGPLIEQGRSDARRGLDFMPMLGRLKRVIGSADLGVCHIETPFADRSGPFSGYPTFNSPPQIATAIKRIGYDTCSTASNHTIDQGEAGVRRTIATLDAAHLRHTGSARSAAEGRRLTILNVKGVKVAHLSYTYGTNGIPEPGSKPWLVNDGLRAGRILADAGRAKGAGAQVVIVSLHWGEEYHHAPTAEQRALARRLLASANVDLILGCHAHVVQPYERINGKWVAYGMGNQVANPYANAATTHEGIVAKFRFTRDPASGRWRATPSFVPTLVTGGPPIRLLTLAKGRGHETTIRRTTGIVRGLGESVPQATGY